MHAPREDGEVNVLGLHVLVAQPGGVERLEPVGDGAEDVVGLAQIERPAEEALGQRLALVNRHRQPHVVARRPVILELDDVGVADRGEHHQLALDVAAGVERARQDLQRRLVLGHVLSCAT